jgi:hypothetical protein
MFSHKSIPLTEIATLSNLDKRKKERALPLSEQAVSAESSVFQ